MPIRINLDEMLERKGITARELAAAIDTSEVNLSHIRTGKVKAFRFSTLEKKLCRALSCTPGDLITLVDDYPE